MAKAAPAPLSASLLAVPKGAATPATDPIPEADSRAGEAVRQVVQTAPVQLPAPRRAAPYIAPPPVEEPRAALTVRLPLSTQERLREAAHRTRREKQVIVDEAISAWLDENGF